MKNLLKSIMLAGVIFTSSLAFSQVNNSVTVNVEKANIRSVIKMLFKDSENSYSINNDVYGDVTASLKGVTFEKALETLLNQVDSTFVIKDKIYYIVKKTNESISKKNEDQTVLKAENSVRRIRIRHADPQLIFMLLFGTTNPGTPPEMSSIDGIRRGN